MISILRRTRPKRLFRHIPGLEPDRSTIRPPKETSERNHTTSVTFRCSVHDTTHDVRPPRSGGGAGVVLGVFAALMLAVLVAGGAFIFGLVAGAAVPRRSTMDVQNDVVRRTVQRGDRATQIAIVPVEGHHRPNRRRGGGRGRSSANDNVDAVLLRVDSPGGGVTPSDRIDHDLQRFVMRAFLCLPATAASRPREACTSPPAVNASWPSQLASPDPLA